MRSLRKKLLSAHFHDCRPERCSMEQPGSMWWKCSKVQFQLHMKSILVTACTSFADSAFATSSASTGDKSFHSKPDSQLLTWIRLYNPARVQPMWLYQGMLTLSWYPRITGHHPVSPLLLIPLLRKLRPHLLLVLLTRLVSAQASATGATLSHQSTLWLLPPAGPGSTG